MTKEIKIIIYIMLGIILCLICSKISYEIGKNQDKETQISFYCTNTMGDKTCKYNIDVPKFNFTVEINTTVWSDIVIRYD